MVKRVGRNNSLTSTYMYRKTSSHSRSVIENLGFLYREHSHISTQNLGFLYRERSPSPHRTRFSYTENIPHLHTEPGFPRQRTFPHLHTEPGFPIQRTFPISTESLVFLYREHPPSPHRTWFSYTENIPHFHREPTTRTLRLDNLKGIRVFSTGNLGEQEPPYTDTYRNIRPLQRALTGQEDPPKHQTSLQKTYRSVLHR